jgi:hypothetical protein
MAYQTPITINEAIQKIQKKRYVLPSIQREFVWQTWQIEQLFDSIMRDYPISTFLFWQIEKGKIKDFQLYEFLKDFHEKNSKHNKKADLSSDEGVTAILDGQQRLTSLYIGLRGSFSYKMPYYHWDSDHAFPKRKLYLNLIGKPEDESFEYDFRFLTEDESVRFSSGKYWFEVGKIMEFDAIHKVLGFLMLQGLTDTSKFTQEEGQFALNTLNNLYNVIHQKAIISYYEEKGEELDKVLQIFIRVNSGGTKLSYSDLLLSIATAQWVNLDAREEIHKFVDEINAVGGKFNFNKDFVMKACLVMGDFNDVRFKVDNFKKENMVSIESQWAGITKALMLSVKLLSSFGFNRDNLTSTNAVIPVAYYIYKNKLEENYIDSIHFSSDRRLVLEWLVKTLIKRVFSGTPDSIFPPIRNVIKDNLGSFPLQQIIERFRGSNKSIVFTNDELDNILEYQYGNPLTYSILTLLYPGLSNQFNYHVDHIHPKKFFNTNDLKLLGIEDRVLQDKMINCFNKLPNLQLLQGTVNIQKNDKHFADFFNNNMTESERSAFTNSHFLPNVADKDILSFIDFYEERKALLRAKLSSVLGIESQVSNAILT